MQVCDDVFLVNAEVVEGPPGFRELVAELWPELCS
jgi:hypothetical protein